MGSVDLTIVELALSSSRKWGSRCRAQIIGAEISGAQDAS